jgi:hypothetical protein
MNQLSLNAAIMSFAFSGMLAPHRRAAGAGPSGLEMTPDQARATRATVKAPAPSPLTGNR